MRICWCFWGSLPPPVRAFRANAHLSDDETVPKMGHPVVVVRSDMGRPFNCKSPGGLARVKEMQVLRLRGSQSARTTSLRMTHGGGFGMTHGGDSLERMRPSLRWGSRLWWCGQMWVTHSTANPLAVEQRSTEMQVLRLRGSQSTRTTSLRMTHGGGFRMTHGGGFLREDVDVAKMGHSVVVVQSDMGHPFNRKSPGGWATVNRDAGPSTAWFAKCADHFAQDDTWWGIRDDTWGGIRDDTWGDSLERMRPSLRWAPGCGGAVRYGTPIQRNHQKSTDGSHAPAGSL